jgi:hypothetical protein
MQLWLCSLEITTFRDFASVSASLVIAGSLLGAAAVVRTTEIFMAEGHDVGQ